MNNTEPSWYQKLMRKMLENKVSSNPTWDEIAEDNGSVVKDYGTVTTTGIPYDPYKTFPGSAGCAPKTYPTLPGGLVPTMPWNTSPTITPSGTGMPNWFLSGDHQDINEALKQLESMLAQDPAEPTPEYVQENFPLSCKCIIHKLLDDGTDLWDFDFLFAKKLVFGPYTIYRTWDHVRGGYHNFLEDQIKVLNDINKQNGEPSSEEENGLNKENAIGQIGMSSSFTVLSTLGGYTSNNLASYPSNSSYNFTYQLAIPDCHKTSGGTF